MSMDKSAIEEIRNLAVAAASSTLDGKDLFKTIVLPNDLAVKSLEKFQPGRNRYRGTMNTNNIDAFVEYSNNNSGEKCFIDPVGMSACTFFNLGDNKSPGHGDHRAILKLDETALYQALLAIDGRTITQKEAAEWLEDWRDVITPKGRHDENGGQEDISIIKAISAVRNISIKAIHESDHSDHDFGAARSSMDQIEANSKEQLPSGIVFSCVPYEGLFERDFYLRISVLTGGDSPRIKLRLARLEKHREEMAKELRDKLEERIELSGGADVYIGRFSPSE